MAFTPPEHYYNRFDPSKRFEQHLFRAGYVMQSAEFNELQSNTQYRLQQVADALMDDGSVVSGCEVTIAGDGTATIEAGQLYVHGAVREVGPGSLTIPTVGTLTIGVYVNEVVITELEDASLRDPAIGMRNYQEPGAARLRLDLAWGFESDGQDGGYYPVYHVIDGGVVQTQPDFNAIAQAISRYDVTSAGGYYVANGMEVVRAPDPSVGEQSYSIRSGEARVGGRAVEFGASLRVNYAATADVSDVMLEPHLSSGTSTQRVNVNNAPIAEITQVAITAQKTVTVTHGGFTGAIDGLPDESVIELVSVSQGDTTYLEGTDYVLTASDVDWSPAGAEPSPSSTYQVTYNYIQTLAPESPDETGFSVTGALAGTLIQVSYRWKLPRWDALCLLADGSTEWIKGVANDREPIRPEIPDGRLLLAYVYQAWTDVGRYVVNDSVRVAPMSEINGMRSAISDLYDLVAQEKLKNAIAVSEPSAKKGIFVDPFASNAMRDLGIEQTAIIIDGELTLDVVEEGLYPTTPNQEDVVLPHTLANSEIQQLARSTTMKVNPYMVFEPVPATLRLTPSRDVWVQSQVRWAPSVITQNIYRRTWAARAGGTWQQWMGTSSVVVGTETLSDTGMRALETMRSRSVQFKLENFGPGEGVTQILFDGVNVTASGA